MQIRTQFFGSLALLALTFASHAGATEILTTSYTAWKTTVSGPPSEWDFNIPNSTYNSASGYSMNVGSFGPITVTGPDGSGYDLSKTQGYGPSNNLTALAGPADGIGSMSFATPAAGLTAFGLGLGITGTAAPITLTLSDGETFTVTPAVNGMVFIGLSSADAITAFTLTSSSGAQIQLTDFFAGFSNVPADTPAPAAEVATALMIGTGLFLFGACRKAFSNTSLRQA